MYRKQAISVERLRRKLRGKSIKYEAKQELKSEREGG